MEDSRQGESMERRRHRGPCCVGAARGWGGWVVSQHHATSVSARCVWVVLLCEARKEGPEELGPMTKLR